MSLANTAEQNRVYFHSGSTIPVLHEIKGTWRIIILTESEDSLLEEGVATSE